MSVSGMMEFHLHWLEALSRLWMGLLLVHFDILEAQAGEELAAGRAKRTWLLNSGCNPFAPKIFEVYIMHERERKKKENRYTGEHCR